MTGTEGGRRLRDARQVAGPGGGHGSPQPDSRANSAKIESAMPGAGRRAQLPEEVAAWIRERILTGRLRGGAHLHLERLADELGVSVTPVREALLALRGEGFVELQPRRGFTVVPLTRRDVEDTHRLQATLAGELAARAARDIGPQQLARLEALYAEMESAGRCGGEIDELALLFHHELNSVADSGKLAWFLGIALRYTPRRFTSGVPGWRDMAVADHREILVALRNHDPYGARAAMHKHVTHTGRLLTHHLEQSGMWAGGD
ncbi:GntR family transcriptional regulator [Saccharopolyspora erythraea D]|nr:GntR family transcriptional regulator [Saccharopolyspora erythraea D]